MENKVEAEIKINLKNKLTMIELNGSNLMAYIKGAFEASADSQSKMCFRSIYEKINDIMNIITDSDKKYENTSELEFEKKEFI